MYMHKYKIVLHIVGRIYKAQIARPKSLALELGVKYCVQSIFLTGQDVFQDLLRVLNQ